MLVKAHATASTLLAGGVFIATDSAPMAATALASGIVVDADHLLEYMIEHGFSLDIRRFFRLVYEARYKRVFYLLHAWEWFLLLAAAAWATGWNEWTLGALLGYGLHLALDQLGNKGTPWSYFLLWRWRQGFDHARCFPGLARHLAGGK